MRDRTVRIFKNARQVRILCEAIYSVTLFFHWILSKFFCLYPLEFSTEMGVSDHAESEYIIFIHRTPTLQNSFWVICLNIRGASSALIRMMKWNEFLARTNSLKLSMSLLSLYRKIIFLKNNVLISTFCTIAYTNKINEVILIKWHDIVDTICHNEMRRTFLVLIPNTN